MPELPPHPPRHAVANPVAHPVISSFPEQVGPRVGLVCPYSLSTPGGVQNHVIGLAGHLTRTGHHVSVLAPGQPDRDTLDRLGLSPAQFVSTGSAVPVPYNGSVARVSFGPVQAARVRRWLRTEQFDLVHLHEPVTPSVAWHALVATETPVVATFHTANPSSRSMRIAGRVLTDVIDKIDVRIAVSPTAARMVADHLDRDSLVIPNGFDHAEFAEPAQPATGAPEAARHGSGPRLVFLGRLTEARKGLDVLLAALPIILAEHPDLEVLVAGQGRRRLPAPCRALGHVADVERVRLLATADVFVAPHVARESFGLVLIEALAAGAPVVASDLAAFVDVLGGDPRSSATPSCGRLFPAADPRSLAEQVLATLATVPADLAAQRRRGRDLTRRFDWARVGPLVEQAYAQALGGPRTAQVDARRATMSARWPHAA